MQQSAPRYLKKKKSKRWLFWLILAALLSGVGYAAYRMIDRGLEYQREDHHYSEMQSYVNTQTAAAPTEPLIPEPEQEETAEPTIPIEFRYDFPEVDFASLYAVNTEIIGWIYLPDSTINYPLAQHNDNVFYLNRMFNKHENGSGCIFMDCENRADFADDNTVIYGHNMRNNTMFSELTKYKKEEYYKDHPVILLMTPAKNYAMRIFAAESSPTSVDNWLINFDTPESRQAWIDARIAASDVFTGIQPSPDDRLVTLSTCISDRNGNRFLVYGILEE